MIAVIIIAVVMTGLTVTTAFLASRGTFARFSSKLASDSKASRVAFNTSMACIYLGFGIVAPGILLVGNHEKSNAAWAGVKLTGSEQVGRELFAETCGFCHTLKADNAVGLRGPNLDMLKPTAATVLHTINHGCTQTGADGTQCLGYGTMPADIYQGQEARDVAEFVAAVAGRK